MPDREQDLIWLRSRFHDLSHKVGEDRNTLTRHDVEDAAERKRCDEIVEKLLQDEVW